MKKVEEGRRKRIVRLLAHSQRGAAAERGREVHAYKLTMV